MMMRKIPLQSDIIYGPVFSRRLGRSFGIKLLSSQKKICSFDCIYCEYGFTDEVTEAPGAFGFPEPDAIMAAVQRLFQKPRSIDFLTFAGNGEPTLHPDFLEIIRGVKRIRDRLRPDVQLAILSNATQVTKADVIAGLNLLDAPMMKLDAGDEETFQAINRPAASVDFSQILAGLMQIKGLMIQSVLVDGIISNIKGEAYEKWAAALVSLKPDMIHIYSIERPTPVRGVLSVSSGVLRGIEKDLQERFQLPVRAFWR